MNSLTYPNDGAIGWGDSIRSNFHTLEDTINSNSSVNATIVDSTGYGVISGLTTYAQATPNMTVGVLSGVIHLSDSTRLTPTGSSSVAIITADATNPRIDIIYLNSNGTIGYLVGTPLPSPSAPTTPVGAFLLSQIAVSANTTTIITANITDKRKMANTTDGLATEIQNARNGEVNLDTRLDKIDTAVTTNSNKIGDLTTSTNTNKTSVVNITNEINASLSERVKKTTVDITYYVNTSTGSDSNNGLTSGTAFKTIQHAINLLPQIINHIVNINLASGTYNEDITIQGFYGSGQLLINGDAVVSDNYIINSISIFTCHLYTVKITGVKGIGTNAFVTRQCSGMIEFNYIKTDSVGVTGFYIANTSACNISNSLISNKTSYAIYANGAGTNTISNTNSGTGNAIGLRAISGKICKIGTQPSGTTSEQATSGGVIIDSMVQIVTLWTGNTTTLGNITLASSINAGYDSFIILTGVGTNAMYYTADYGAKTTGFNSGTGLNFTTSSGLGSLVYVNDTTLNLTIAPRELRIIKGVIRNGY